MNFRSVADLTATIDKNLHRIPRTVDLIVGVPRSGSFAANLISSSLKVPQFPLDALDSVNLVQSELTLAQLPESSHVLVVDDSIVTGNTMRGVQQRFLQFCPHKQVTFAAVYASASAAEVADLSFEICELPMVFGWSYMHHPILNTSCVDIDGVLCCDPTAEQNDDGPRYLEFLSSAVSLHKPTQEIGYLVSSRLEKYRAQTEAWLRDNGIRYRKLVMLDGYTAQERRRLALHASFKAEVYRTVSADLFIESDDNQASEIAHLTGKPVVCAATHTLAVPRLNKKRSLKQSIARSILGWSRKLKQP